MHPETRRDLYLTGVEVGGIGFVAAFLVALEVFVPVRVEADLVLRLYAADPDPVTFVTASYFHFDRAHLTSNLVGYLVGAGLTYAICRSIGERRWYWLTFGSMLVVIPFTVNWLNATVFVGLLPGGFSEGFSDVVSGFAGFLFVCLLAAVRSQFSRSTVAYVGAAVLVAIASELQRTYAPSAVPVNGLVAVSVLVPLFGLAVNGARRRSRDAVDWTAAAEVAVAVATAIAVLVWAVHGMFPAEVRVDGAFLNVFAHATGFVLGAVISGWGHRYWATQSWWDGRRGA